MLGRLMVISDTHLSSKNYGMHKDYPNETLRNFREVTRIAEEQKPDVIVGLGDLTYGRFHTLEYREAVEKELEKQFNITHGRRYELKGNHDSATNGMTEYEFYTAKGLIKKAENFDIGNAHFTLVDHGKVRKAEPNIVLGQGHVNFIFAHDYLKFKDTQLPNFGTAIELDELSQWYGADYIICGHIHKKLGFKGSIISGDRAHEATVIYPGCMSRPSYSNDLDTEGIVVIIDINEDGTYEHKIIQFPLIPIEEAFVMADIEENKARKEIKDERVDISDIVHRLDARDNSIGNPEDIIASMQGIDERYKQKAIQLLYEA